MLWVDAVCINQGDPREKGHQVKQMGNIYKGAEEVLIWLGPSDDNIASLLKHISWVDAKATEAQAMGSNEDWTSLCRQFMGEWFSALQATTRSKPRQVLVELLKRPWFKRVWILQEIANARTARILCGPCSCPARAFALMPPLMDLAVDLHTQAVLDIMPRLRKKSWWSSNRQLHFLLDKFGESQALMIRDKIYALLGMSEDACDPEAFYPCYEKTDDEVFRDTASFLLFGEIVGPSYSFPSLRFLDLRLPTSQLAGVTLKWALTRKRLPSARKTADALVRRMDEGRLKTPAVLSSLVLDQAQVERVHKILAHKDLNVTVGFDHLRDILVFTITSGSAFVPEATTLSIGYDIEIRF
jgi:hypothetical protein